jgi:hypothetical protein
MDVSRLWYPEIVHSGPKHEFFIIDVPRVSEMLRNTPKHHFGTNRLEWMLHNFGTTEILHSGPKHEFFIIDVPRVSEMLRNTPKHHFGSNGLEWMLHNFGTLEIVHLGPKHKFCIFLHDEG